MKARIKATGEIVELAPYTRVCEDFAKGRSWLVEELCDADDVPDYWIRLEHQYAGMAMQGLVANQSIVYGQDFDEALDEHITVNAVAIAHALVEQLKEKEESK
jgi:hypothetical protein